MTQDIPPPRPGNPISFGPGGPAATRFAGAPVDDAVLERLGTICRIDTDGDGLTAAGRDWWPLALMWAHRGMAPAVPAAVVRPASTAEVAAVLAVCNEARVPVTAGGGRSGVCGGVVPVYGGIALDTTALAGPIEVDDVSLLVDVGGGTFGDDFEASLRADHGLTLGHWPQSMALSTVGGWVACRSAGQYSTRYGKIEDMTAGLEVVLADGTIVHTGGSAPRAATGPDLTHLFLGSEGTLGVVTATTLRVHHVPDGERRAAFAFDDFTNGLHACRRILQRGATPAVLRLYDERESRRTFDVHDGSVLIVLDEGDPAVVDAIMGIVTEECRGIALDAALVQRWLDHRNDVSGLGTAIEGGFVVDTCEVAGRWSALPALYADALAALKAVDGTWVASAHQSHAYSDGACLYFTFAGKPDADDAERYYRDAWDAVTRATLEHGGAISHHHGVGLNRDRFMAGALGSGLDVLTAVKAALDPHGILNPGKLGLPSPFGVPAWP